MDIYKKYKKLGYIKKDLDDEKLELENLINWILEKYKIYLETIYHNKIHVTVFSKKILNFNNFSTNKIYLDSDEKFYPDKYFSNPYESRLNAVKELYKFIKFL